MTEARRHLVAVPDDPGPLIAAWTLERTEEIFAIEIHNGSLRWNVETDEVVRDEDATDEWMHESAAAMKRHLARVAAGEPLPANVRSMQEAFRRALKRQEAEQLGDRYQ